LYAGPKYFDKLKPEPEPGPTRLEKPAQTYNSAPCQKFHSKSFTCITTQIHLRLNQNAQLWIGKKVLSFTFKPLTRKECATKLP